MSVGIIVLESLGRFYPFTFDDVLYDSMKETLASEEGVRMYGMRFISGRKGIPNEKIDGVVKYVSGLTDKLNNKESFDVDNELEKILEKIL